MMKDCFQHLAFNLGVFTVCLFLSLAPASAVAGRDYYLGEAEGAEFTLVRLLARVDPQMLGQGARVTERFLTQPTSDQ